MYWTLIGLRTIPGPLRTVFGILDGTKVEFCLQMEGRL